MKIMPRVAPLDLETIHFFMLHIATNTYVGCSEPCAEGPPSIGAHYFVGDENSSEQEIRDSFELWRETGYEVIGFYQADDPDREDY